MSLVEMTHENFDKIVDNNSIVFVDFWAEWCAPCKAFTKIYQEVAKQYSDCVFAQVNIETEQRLADDFNVRSIPHLLVLKDKIAVFSESGSMPKTSLEELVEQAKKLDLSEVRKNLEED